MSKTLTIYGEITHNSRLIIRFYVKVRQMKKTPNVDFLNIFGIRANYSNLKTDMKWARNLPPFCQFSDNNQDHHGEQSNMVHSVYQHFSYTS